MLNLVTVVGENTHLLPHMLNHYKDIVDKIYVVVYRQSEDDGILEEVKALGIEPYLIVTEEKYNWSRVTDLYNFVKSTKPDEWWIVSDDDELQVYPRPIHEIIEECERNGYDFVTGGFVDRIGKDGTFPIVTPETNLLEAFPNAGFFRYPMSSACPNKVVLMKGHQKVTSGQHYALFGAGDNSWGTRHEKRMPTIDCFVQVHHFKWDSTCVDRIKKVADVNNKHSYSAEYLTMYNAIKNNGFKIDITNPEYMVEEVNDLSYITYTKWNRLRRKIIKI